MNNNDHERTGEEQKAPQNMTTYDTNTPTTSSPGGYSSGEDGSYDQRYRQPIKIVDRKLQSASKHRKYPRRGGDSPKMLKFHVKKFLFTRRGADAKDELHIPFAELQLPFETRRRASSLAKQEQQQE